MMSGSVKSATAEEVDPAVYFGSSGSANSGDDNDRNGGGSIVSAPQGSRCASENGRCNFSGTRDVYYGANGRYAVRSFSNGVDCTNGVFGDPVRGVVKACFVHQGAGTQLGQSWARDGVNGWNVEKANHRGGRLEMHAPGQWTEFDGSGIAGFSFTETGRDEWSVYLNDASRNVQLQIDIHRKMITYGTNGGQRSDLYTINGSWRRR